MEQYDELIGLALYFVQGGCLKVKQYIGIRRMILSQIQRKSEFTDFMPGCFRDIRFAVDIESQLNAVRKFKENTEEIVHDLSVINDNAVTLYKTYRDDIVSAIRIIDGLVRECTDDPKHKDKLCFTFRNDNGNLQRTVCSIHTKLIRADSDLRIYFYWCHPDIGKGEKALVGRIGTHPYWGTL